MNAQDLIALGLAVAALAYVVRLIARTLRGKGGCGCSKGKGACGAGQRATAGRAGIKRVPLVTINQIGVGEVIRDDKTVRHPE